MNLETIMTLQPPEEMTTGQKGTDELKEESILRLLESRNQFAGLRFGGIHESLNPPPLGMPLSECCVGEICAIKYDNKVI